MKKSINILPQIIFSLIISLFGSQYAHCEPTNLSLVKQEIRKYHDSGQYDSEFKKKIDQAQQYLSEQIHHYHSHKTGKKLAIVLDIDETCLSNYSKFAKYDFGGTAAQIHEEIMAANSPALEPMQELYQNALSNGIKVFFVTGRHESELAATKTNLINAGYTQWTGLYLRPNNYDKKSIIPFKAASRAKIAQKGYVILATIGDQYSDIWGGYANKGFKLPNPFYYIP